MFPEKFLSSLAGLDGFDQPAFVAAHLQSQASTSIRINPAKVSSISHGSMIAAAVPWCSHGFYLTSRPSFTFDPLFHAGCYYVQEASSMFLEQALRQSADLTASLRILDLCAAPGGKSTLVQSLISAGSLLVSNEVIKSRISGLQENMVKWGAQNVVITNNDPADFSRLENYFDVVVADVPCSGSGLFRKEPEATSTWSEQGVAHCSLRQRRIVSDVWPCLKQGGVLIYSTCSFSKMENEDILDWLAASLPCESFSLTVDPAWGVTETHSDEHKMAGYRFYPDKTKGEGFFIAVLKKLEGGTHFSRKVKSTLPALTHREKAMTETWLKADPSIRLFRHGDQIHSIQEKGLEDLPLLQSALYLKKAGVEVGQPLEKEMIPHHALALSLLVNDAVPAMELSREDAIQYLRRESFSATGAATGWALAQFEKHNLGWIKVLTGRVNNYYPKEWRILKSPQ